MPQPNELQMDQMLQTAQVPRVAIAHGDGIGPEIMDATLRILDAAGARLVYDKITVGQAVYESGVKSGIPTDAWDILRRNKVFLKAPITTPQGGGYKSLNVTIRKSLGLYANVRPVEAYTPYVDCASPNMNIVIVRENEEDLYAGIEHRQTNEVVQCLKVITHQGCERIIRYAFEYARAYNRKKVTCMTKDNIMKLTDGLFHQVFDEVKLEYPDIETDHYIIDIGAAMLATRPEKFDVVVTLNLYGDIISDIVAQVSGSVGLGGSANIGEGFAMFEAIHGSAPDIAGKGIANPSGLLQGACLMLVHLGQADVAQKIQNAWLRTLEDGIHTGDIASEAYTHTKVGTQAFADAVIERLGQEPKHLHVVRYAEDSKPIELRMKPQHVAQKELVGVDIFLDWSEAGRNPESLAKALHAVQVEGIKLKMITNRGVKVYPEGLPETYCSDHWRCRFVSSTEQAGIDYKHIVAQLEALSAAGLNFIKIENLYTFDGKLGYSLGQGE